MQRKRIAILSTGGTIEKTYDELEGVLTNPIEQIGDRFVDGRGPAKHAIYRLSRLFNWHYPQCRKR